MFANQKSIHTAKYGLVLLFLSMTLAACGGGASTETREENNPASVEYSGPPPASTDVQSFRIALWENLKSNSRCGGCHYAGGQAPMFVRTDDINLAYSAARQIVTLGAPEESLMVTKVAGGHNCWDAAEVCRELLTAYIRNWAGNTTDSARAIVLNDPVIREPGNSKSFPSASAGFAAIHTLLTSHCINCHTESSPTPQAPYFANANIDTAYAASQSKIDLDTPANSRLVVRLRDEFHNCWSGNCPDDASDMLTAITGFSDTISVTTVNPDLVPSKSLFIGDGIIASGGQRHETNVIALYEFQHLGADNIAYDTSGIEPALNLNLSGNINWLPNYGIEIISGKAQGHTQPSKKLHDLIKATGEYSVEAWLVPANVTQEGPARIISYSANANERNFTLGQTLYNYNYLHRSTTTDTNGEPDLSTADADEVLQATLQHVVMTFDPINGRRIYVNGKFTGDVDPSSAGNINDWDDSFALILGNEASNNRQWKGSIRMLAIHNRAMTASQIQQNFDVGIGKKLFLLFSVTDLVNLPRSYIMFEVSQLDSYSYLFNKPTFISLDASSRPNNIALKGIRIGINGKEATIGQGYYKIDTRLREQDYTSSGIILSNIGTILPLEKGELADEFFLTFDIIGEHTNAMSRTTTFTATPVPDPDASSDIAVRIFSEINASMSAVTGVSPQTGNVRTTYTTIEQQLPAIENIEGFISSNQVAITQLAFEYCSALVDSASLRSTFFSGFDFNSNVVTAFSTADSAAKTLALNNLTTQLYNNMITTGLSTAPTYAEIRNELGNESDADSNGIGDGLFEQLSNGCTSSNCTAARTRIIVKAMCTAVLGSAAMLIQ
ncbi:MAG: LamG domain-containing protein [Gammaproteobacteria bacterium]|nr:LamG domain-containing protein [Gammaproteobacteria bacterium]